MDGHQLRGARIHRDMMLVSSVCRRALGCEWGGKGMMLGHSSVVSKYGAPLTRTPPRQSFGAAGRHPRGGGEFRPVDRRVFYCALCSVDGSSPWSWGRFIIASTPCFCVGIGDQHSGIVLDCSKSSRQCSLSYLLTYLVS